MSTTIAIAILIASVAGGAAHLIRMHVRRRQLERRRLARRVVREVRAP